MMGGRPGTACLLLERRCVCNMHVHVSLHTSQGVLNVYCAAQAELCSCQTKTSSWFGTDGGQGAAAASGHGGSQQALRLPARSAHPRRRCRGTFVVIEAVCCCATKYPLRRALCLPYKCSTFAVHTCQQGHAACTSQEPACITKNCVSSLGWLLMTLLRWRCRGCFAWQDGADEESRRRCSSCTVAGVPGQDVGGPRAAAAGAAALCGDGAGARAEPALRGAHAAAGGAAGRRDAPGGGRAAAGAVTCLIWMRAALPNAKTRVVEGALLLMSHSA